MLVGATQWPLFQDLQILEELLPVGSVIGPTEAGANGMEIKELDVNIRPVGEARSGRIFVESTIISIPNIALKLAVGAEDQELVES